MLVTYDRIVVALIHKRAWRTRYREITSDGITSYDLAQLLFDQAYPSLEMLQWTENMARVMWAGDYVETWSYGKLVIIHFPREVLGLFGYDYSWSRYATTVPADIARQVMRENAIPEAEIDHRLFGRGEPTPAVLISAAAHAVCAWKHFHDEVAPLTNS